MYWSNWLEAQASMLKWPELCGRGATSLTRSPPERVQEHLDAEDSRRARAGRARGDGGLAKRGDAGDGERLGPVALRHPYSSGR